MTIDKLITHAAELCRIIDTPGKAADASPGAYFRFRKYIGSKERKFISQAAYSYYRNMDRIKLVSERAGFNPAFTDESIHIKGIAVNLLLSHALGNDLVHVLLPKARITSESFLEELAQSPLFNEGMTKDFLINWQNALIESNNLIYDEIMAIILNSETDTSLIETSLSLLAKYFSFPELAVKSALCAVPAEEIISFFDSLNSEADFTMRINPELITRQKAMTYLSEKYSKVTPGLLSPHAIRSEKRLNIKHDNLFKIGAIEVQDEASQLVGFALDASPGEDILDACAGGGGKAMHLAALTKDKARILSADVSRLRLDEVSRRAAKAKFKSIKTYYIKDFTRGKDYFWKKFDRILIDAPCSGSGTAKRDPAVKQHLTEENISRFSKKQSDILHTYSQNLKPGGTLVYATCSFLREENEDVIENFLKSHSNFRPADIGNALINAGIDLEGIANKFMLRVAPHRYNVDAFFIAGLQKM